MNKHFRMSDLHAAASLIVIIAASWMAITTGAIG